MDAHPGKTLKIRDGELAPRNVFERFSEADKARSASGRRSPECEAFGT